MAIIEDDPPKYCLEIAPFSFYQFEFKFIDQRIKYESIQPPFDDYIKTLKENEQFSTAAAYLTACNAFHKFKGALRFEDIIKELLQKFENWMLVNNYSITTRLKSLPQKNILQN